MVTDNSTLSGRTNCGCTAAEAVKNDRRGALKARYRIDNMDCPTEEALIRGRLAKVPGVDSLFWAFDEIIRMGLLWAMNEAPPSQIYIEMPTANRPEDSYGYPYP